MSEESPTGEKEMSRATDRRHIETQTYPTLMRYAKRCVGTKAYRPTMIETGSVHSTLTTSHEGCMAKGETVDITNLDWSMLLGSDNVDGLSSLSRGEISGQALLRSQST